MHTSVILERPAHDHPPIPPETVTLTWIGMGVALAIVLVLAGLHWAGKRAERRVDTSPQEPDQEWSHYPQAGDK